jgi:hypothetical protein
MSTPKFFTDLCYVEGDLPVGFHPEYIALNGPRGRAYYWVKPHERAHEIIDAVRVDAVATAPVGYTSISSKLWDNNYGEFADFYVKFAPTPANQTSLLMMPFDAVVDTSDHTCLFDVQSHIHPAVQFVTNTIKDSRWQYSRKLGKIVLTEDPSSEKFIAAWRHIHLFARYNSSNSRRPYFLLSYGKESSDQFPEKVSSGYLYAIEPKHSAVQNKQAFGINRLKDAGTRKKYPKAHDMFHDRSLVFATSFEKFLHKIKDDSRIAKVIIGVGDLFLKAKDLGQRSDLHFKVLTGADVSYITYRDNGMISFLPKGKEHLKNGDGSWKKDGRQEGKPSRVMRQIFTPLALKLFNEKDFEIFNNMYKAEFLGKKEFEFKVLDGDKIKDVYCGRPYKLPEVGTLGGSCMRNRDCVSFYAKVGARILILVNTETNMLVGRALLWKAKHAVRGQEDQEIDFMDRVYTTGDTYDQMFLSWAKENGFYRKNRFTSREYKTDMIAPNGDRLEMNLKIEVNLMKLFADDTMKLPYIDTFTYGIKGQLRNFESGKLFTFEDTEDKFEFMDEAAGEWYTGVRSNEDDDYEEEEDEDGYIIERERSSQPAEYWPVVLTAGRHKNKIARRNATIIRSGLVYHVSDQVNIYIKATGRTKAMIIGEDISADEIVKCEWSSPGTWIYKTEAFKIAHAYCHERFVSRVVESAPPVPMTAEQFDALVSVA